MIPGRLGRWGGGYATNVAMGFINIRGERDGGGGNVGHTLL